MSTDNPQPMPVLQPMLEAWKRESARNRSTEFQRFEAGWAACKAHVIAQIDAGEPQPIVIAATPEQVDSLRQAIAEANGTAPRVDLREDDCLSIDVQQVIYALERAERRLQRLADRLFDSRDYSAEFPAEDAQRMREAIQLLQGRSPTVARLQSEVDNLKPQADALHQAGHTLGLMSGVDLTVDVVLAIKSLQIHHKSMVDAYNSACDDMHLWKRRALAAEGKLHARRRVRKTGGSFQHTGTVVAEFQTLAGQPRLVLEFDAPVAGMLHVYRPDQVQELGPEPEHIPY